MSEKFRLLRMMLLYFKERFSILASLCSNNVHAVDWQFKSKKERNILRPYYHEFIALLNGKWE
jgi:hypothetical protein